MVALTVVRESNERLRELGPGLVALFVGATSGIGEAAAKAFVEHTITPRVYLVGRNSDAAERIISESKALNKDAQIEFIKADVSELKEVDRVCKEIQRKEKHVNLIYQTQGNFNLRGYDPNPEGIDRKYTLNYYSRMRFIYNLLPLLRNASTSTSGFSRSVSVLSAGHENKIDFQDLALEKSYSMKNVADYSTLMNSFMTEEFASRAPGTSFIHAYPSGVNTGLFRELPLWARIGAKVSTFFLGFILVPLEETGQRQLFNSTSGVYRPNSPNSGVATAAGVSLSKDLKVANGSNGKPGSGTYWANWNNDVVKRKAFLQEYRKQGYSKTIWEHTIKVFEKAEK